MPSQIDDMRSQAQFSNSEKSVDFEKGIFVGILPVSMMFFVPFFLADQLKLNFWWYLDSALALLAVGYWAHKIVLGTIS